MHRRWMSLPLLSSCVSAFYPYHELSVHVDGDGDRSAAGPSKRFIPYHQVLDDVPDAVLTLDLKKVYRRDNKFAIVTSNNVDAVNALPIHQDGSDFSYFSTMKFGSKGQTMYMLIDTGSANTWVFGEECASKSCGIHNLFGTPDSTTLKTTSNKWSLTYGTGTVSGTVASDTVAFAAFSINMGFGLASTASDDFLSYPMDGILGLGRASTNELNTPTVMDVLASQKKIASKVIGVHLHRAADNTKDGVITIGGIDAARFTGSLSYTKTSNTGAWEIPVDDAFVNDTPCKFANKKAIIDTGTSYILLPPADAQALHKLIPGSTQSGENFIIPCDTSAKVAVSFSGTKWTVSPKDYVGKPAPTGNGCTSNIVGHQAYGADEWILGDVFLKNVYAVFDFDQSQIGFGATGAATDSPAPTPSASTSPSSTASTSVAPSASGLTTSVSPSASRGPSASATASSSASPTPSSNTGTPFDLNTTDNSKTTDEKNAGTLRITPITWGSLRSATGLSYALVIAFVMGLSI